jgi:hypothetical protein
MEPALLKALKRKQELQVELARVQQFLDLYVEFAGTNPEDLEAHLPVDKSVLEEARTLARFAHDGTIQLRVKQRGRPADFGRIMAAILKDMRRPLQRSEFVAEVETRGHVIPSEDKARYLGTILWRHRDEFVNIPDVGYWLKNEPCEAIHYVPGDVIDNREGPTEEEATGDIFDTKAFIR